MEIEILPNKDSINLKDFQKDAIYFDEHYDEYKNYTNKYVAIKGGKRVAIESDMESIVKRLEERNISPSSAFVGFISDEQVFQ